MSKAIDYREKTQEEVRRINSTFSMKEVVETLTGVKVSKNNELVCPLHTSVDGEPNASISKDNRFSCWSHRCCQGSDIMNFVQKWYKQQGVTDFREIYKNFDNMFGTNLFQSKQDIKKQCTKEHNFDEIIDINKYCTEQIPKVIVALREYRNILINAKTGTGKTRLIADVGEMLKEVDFVFLLTARRSIVEEIGNEYPYETFLGNDQHFKEVWKEEKNSDGELISVVNKSRLIVATTHKARAINEELWNIQCERRGLEPTYAVIIDECHLLHASRNIIGNINQLERLIQGARYSIFTSANTDHFYNASKEEYQIERYLNLERTHKMYNLDKLDIVRLVCNGTAKMDYVKRRTIEELENGKKVLYINNNKAFNKELCEELQTYKIKADHINAENKELEAYENIIKKSVLSSDVTICTSVIDTGVNIHTDNVTTIISCNNLTFDDISIIQGFARVRTTKGNKGILILEEGQKDRDFKRQRLVSVEHYNAQLLEIVDSLKMWFNEHMLNNFDCTDYEEYLAIWDLYKGNEMYTGFGNCLKVICDKGFSNPRLVVDKVAIYEKARKQQLIESYFSNEFVGKALKDIMAKEVNWSDCIVIGEKIEKESTEGSQEDFKKEVEFILNDKRSLDQLEKHYFYGTKLSETEVLIDLMEIDKKRTMEVDKTIKKLVKTCTKTKRVKKYFNYKAIIKKCYDIQLMDDKKDRAKEEQKLIYTMYNNIYETVGYQEEDGLGDLVYTSLRETIDKVIKQKNPISKKHITLCAMEYKNKNLSILGKEVKESVCSKRILKAFELIYNVSEKGYGSLNKDYINI